MSSFLFLTFCVYVFRCLGLHFQPFLFQIRSSDGFYLCRTNLHRSLTPGQQGWSAASVVSFPYPASKTAHKAAQGRSGAALVSFPYPRLKPPHRGKPGRVWFFSPERAYPSPFRGRGWVSSNLARWDFNVMSTE